MTQDKDDVFVSSVQSELKKIGEMLVAKNKAYGNSAFRKPLFVDVDPQTAIMVRANDKINRLDNLLKNGGSENGETIDDTIRDLAGYFVLLLIDRIEEKQLGM